MWIGKGLGVFFEMEHLEQKIYNCPFKLAQVVALQSISWQWLVPAFCYQNRSSSFLRSLAAG